MCHRSRINHGQGVLFCIAIQHEGFLRHFAKYQAKDAVVRADKVLPFKAYRKEPPSRLVVVVDTDQVDRPLRVMPPDTLKDEGSTDDVVRRHFVAQVGNLQVPVRRHKVGFETGQMKVFTAKIGRQRKDGCRSLGHFGIGWIRAKVSAFSGRSGVITISPCGAGPQVQS